jgi:RNA polymerase sigma factor (sigma-70 family)
MESVRIDRQTRMDIAELKAELQQLHSASFGWALSCCGRDREEAEEVLQTVYLKILEGKAQFRGEASLKTWLFAVIRKTAMGERRKNLLRRLVLDRGSGHTAPAEVAEQPAAVFERSETQARFQTALRSLPARQREALHLVFYEDLTLREAADVMRVSIGSVRQHYERGKKRLRESLDQAEVAYGINWRGKENPGAV